MGCRMSGAEGRRKRGVRTEEKELKSNIPLSVSLLILEKKPESVQLYIQDDAGKTLVNIVSAGRGILRAAWDTCVDGSPSTVAGLV